MKRLFILLSFFALMGLNCQAQIQNKIYDFVLGQTTKDEVKNYFNGRPEIEIEEEKTGVISAIGLTFGGCYWDVTFFDFYEDTFMTVYFSAIDTEEVSIAEINSNFEKLKRSLNKKYASYLLAENSNDENLVYFDGNIMLGLKIGYENGKRNLTLHYQEGKLSLKRMNSEETEL